MIRISVAQARELRAICVERDAQCMDHVVDLQGELRFWTQEAERARALRSFLDREIHLSTNRGATS